MTAAEIISSGVLELFVMGQTNEQETQQVLQWKNEYPEVAEELNNIEIALEKWAMANAIPPAPASKKKLLDSIQAVHPANTAKLVTIKPNNGQTLQWKWMAAASFALLIASSVITFLTLNKYQNLRQELAEIKENRQQTDKELEIILTAHTEPLQLKGTPYSPNSTAKIFWVKNTGDVYVAPNGLPAAPNGMQYQLWAIIDGQPVDAGMIIKNDNGNKYNIQKMKSFGKAEAFAITLEKEGGSSTPSMDKMYVITKVI